MSTELTPTHSAFLELKEERVGMQEGYRFLDEKRLVLAAELMAQLRALEQAWERYRQRQQHALEALMEAVGRHGLEGIQLAPVDGELDGDLGLQSRRVLGVEIQEGHCSLQAPIAKALHSPELRRCAEAFRELVPEAAQLATIGNTLERLRSEYLKTARRARALEDVLLPEIDASLQAIASALEEMEREDAIRVRRVGRGGQG